MSSSGNCGESFAEKPVGSRPPAMAALFPRTGEAQLARYLELYRKTTSAALRALGLRRQPDRGSAVSLRRRNPPSASVDIAARFPPEKPTAARPSAEAQDWQCSWRSGNIDGLRPRTLVLTNRLKMAYAADSRLRPI